jgi:hypothetical protein
MSEKKKLLSIKIAGHNPVVAFKNEDRTGNQPHYKGDGVAVWINDYEPKNKKIKEEFVKDDDL